MTKQSYDFTLRSQKIAEGLYKENDLRYVPIWQQLGTLLLGMKDYEQAVVVLKQVFQVFLIKQDSSAGNAPDPNYAAVLLLLGECFYQMDDFLQSAEYYEKAASYIKDCYGESESYAMVLNNLTAVYQRSQNEVKAIEYQKKSDEVLKACAKE